MAQGVQGQQVQVGGGRVCKVDQTSVELDAVSDSCWMGSQGMDSIARSSITDVCTGSLEYSVDNYFQFG